MLCLWLGVDCGGRCTTCMDPAQGNFVGGTRCSVTKPGGRTSEGGAWLWVVALGGAFVNFKLIALPMSEMVGAGDYLTASLRTSEVAALVIIFVEATMGLFLMETLRITHLFPRIHNLGEAMRRRMVWIAFVLLLALAGIEAALALMRDVLLADKQALLQSLAATQAVAAEGWLSGIPTAGQMLLGFILPFALVLEPQGGISGAAWPYMLYIGLIVAPIGTWCVIEVGRRLPGAVASIAFLLVPAFGVLVSTLWLGEPLGWDMLAGGTLIVASVALAARESLPTAARP